jgi:glyoxylase-like metal-dependent hydrolase (beta-lactamase superfamily II)
VIEIDRRTVPGETHEQVWTRSSRTFARAECRPSALPRSYLHTPIPITGRARRSCADAQVHAPWESARWVRVGDLELVAIETPGHCRGHFSYFVQGYKRKLLFAGDLVFFGGAVILQNIPDCSIQEYADSVCKLEGLGVNALLCGHMTLPLRSGQKHIDQAIAAFRGLMVPKNLL